MRAAILLIAILFGATWGQNEQRRIGSIDFYGYAGLNLEQIKAALPLRVGDLFPGPFETMEGIKKAVTTVTGRSKQRSEATRAITFRSIGATDRDGPLARRTCLRRQNPTRANSRH